MKMPPKEKILEAYSAIADKRIEMHENSAEVHSSDASKTYLVEWDGDTFASSDPATYWQSYPGYPVLAVLLKQGRLPLDEELIQSMAGIPWKKLNDAHKRDYAAAAEEAMKDIENKEAVLKLAEEGNRALETLNLTLKRKLKKK
ncbi:MAG: hypothetical protein IJM63_02455 [Solobacterium sp.]|nr:hypothetical protein [Solobacterium sp.]